MVVGICIRMKEMVQSNDSRLWDEMKKMVMTMFASSSCY